MKKIIKYLTLALLLPIIAYFLLSYILTLFPKEPTQSGLKSKEVYLLYSEIHSDIVFHIEDINSSFLNEFQTKKRGYLAFGWGEKEVYMSTATLSDIKLSTSLKALFLNTPSIMHVAYYPTLQNYTMVKKIELSSEELVRLQKSIFNDFMQEKKAYEGYEKSDFFYESKGVYNLFHTCNTWTGDKLRGSNVRMSYWTPLSQNVRASLP